MAFVVAHRVSAVTRLRGRPLLRTGRILIDKLCARHTLTPQERANLYVSRMPIAVVTASLGGHPSNHADNRR